MAVKAPLKIFAVVLLLNACAPLTALAYGEERKSFRDITMSPAVSVTPAAGSANGAMRADAEEIATILNARILANTIRSARANSASPIPRAVQQARLLCLYKIMIASEEVRKTVAAIDYEVSNSNANLDHLVAKRNMTANMLNTANFAQGGSAGTVKQSLSFHGGAPLGARQEIAMASFGTSIAISLVNLMLAKSWNRKIDSAPNSLSQVFDEKRQPSDANQSYLWKYITSPIPGSTDNLTRREILVKHFEANSGIDPADQITIKRVAAMPVADRQLNESIRILSKRIDLLHDLKTHIEEFDGALFEFHEAIEID